MGLEKHHVTAVADRLPLSQKVAYGLGGVVPIALANIVAMLMGLVTNIGFGISAVLIGWIMVVPRLWDAFTDPMMGYISDNTRSRWGRRRPYILWGGIGVCISFIAMWWIPKGSASGGEISVWVQLTFVMVQLLLFYTMVTIFEIPHGALGLEMTDDYHERTRLFSFKSFIGNVGAMATPWLYALAQLEIFKGAGGNETDGMRPVSILVALLVLPMVLVCYRVCKEGKFEQAKSQEKTTFRTNLKLTFQNKTFLVLVVIVFMIIMGFNFVGNFGNYITIFYLYAGDKVAAAKLMGITGTVWGIASMLAIFPLNWISSRFGKTQTLVIAVLLMVAAQLSKIVCYNPEHPYLVLIPTVLLSAGMVMFFTLGPAMVADVCDEEELKTGLRNEGAYYSIFWWFMKTGMAFAWLVAGMLLAVAQFDDKQSSMVDRMSGPVREVVSQMEKLHQSEPFEIASITNQLERSAFGADNLREHFTKRQTLENIDAGHYGYLVEEIDAIKADLQSMTAGDAAGVSYDTVLEKGQGIVRKSLSVSRQSPGTLFRLRIFEIVVPMVLCIIGLLALKLYPLSEDRVYEIKAELERRKENG